MSFFCYRCRKRISFFFSCRQYDITLSLLKGTKRKPRVNIGERTQVTLDDQIYISLVHISCMELFTLLIMPPAYYVHFNCPFCTICIDYFLFVLLILMKRIQYKWPNEWRRSLKKTFNHQLNDGYTPILIF